MKDLVDCIREVMEPNTASRLQVKKRNIMKDFLSVASMFGVTHFVVFSQTEKTLSMRIAKCPHGPTLQFHVNQFSLSRDIRSHRVQRRPVSVRPTDFVDSPLVVLNNFSANDGQREVQLMAHTFQNMFPAINVHQVRLSQCTRVVLFHRNPETGVVSFRHYKIVVNPVGVSRAIRRVAQAHVPKQLGKLDDVSRYILDQGLQSAESEQDDEDARVEVTQRVRGIFNRPNVNLDEEVHEEEEGGQGDQMDLEDDDHPAQKAAPQKKQGAIRLVEIGPRIEFTLAKVQAEFFQGEVMYHWKGLDLELLNEQRKKLKAAGKKAKGDFDGLDKVLEMGKKIDAAQKEREKKIQEKEQEREYAKRKKKEGMKKRAEKKKLRK